MLIRVQFSSKEGGKNMVENELAYKLAHWGIRFLSPIQSRIRKRKAHVLNSPKPETTRDQFIYRFFLSDSRQP